MNDLKADQLLLPLGEWNALEKAQDAVFQEWLAEWNSQEASSVLVAQNGRPVTGVFVFDLNAHRIVFTVIPFPLHVSGRRRGQ